MQNDLGNTLALLGEREGVTAHLTEAVAAFHAALEEWTRKRVPLLWATANLDLGVALLGLGERASGGSSIALLQDAVAAFDAALSVLVAQGATYDVERTSRNRDRAVALLAARSRAAAVTR
jgi:hypothetical protein